MGNSIFKRLFADKNVKILMMGNVDSAQAEILRRLKLGKVELTMPIEGVFVQTLHHRNVEISAVDLASRMSIRPLLPHYFTTIHGLIFAVDCHGYCYRVDETIRDFCEKIEDDNLPMDVPVLVLAANDPDTPNAMTLDEITDMLGKENIFKNRRWIVHGINICNKDENGLFEAFDWLTNEMLVNDKEKMALTLLAGVNVDKTTISSDKMLNETSNKSFLSKFVESLKKTLVCRPVMK